MGTMFRVFAKLTDGPMPDAIAGCLQTLSSTVSTEFQGDEVGWFRGIINIPELGNVLTLERYLTSEQGIRAELNRWVAWLETHESNPQLGLLIDHLTATSQLFTITVDGDESSQALSLGTSLSRFIARQTDAIYQIDGQGFFDMDGALLLRED